RGGPSPVAATAAACGPRERTHHSTRADFSKRVVVAVRDVNSAGAIHADAERVTEPCCTPGSIAAAAALRKSRQGDHRPRRANPSDQVIARVRDVDIGRGIHGNRGGGPETRRAPTAIHATTLA